MQEAVHKDSKRFLLRKEQLYNESEPHLEPGRFPISGGAFVVFAFCMITVDFLGEIRDNYVI